MKNIFVFFYTSPKGAFDYRLPLLLTRSIKNNFYNSKIYQISDINTPKVEGVDKLVIREKISENIMLDRAEAYRDLALLEPAIYLDTDMFVIKKFDIEKILRENEVIFLRRSFAKDTIFKTQQKGSDFKEYTDFTLDKVYPYIGCFYISKSFVFWEKFVNIYKKLNKKFYKWYGDQEVIRIISGEEEIIFSEVNESKFACPPKHWNKINDPIIIHAKGDNVKEKFINLAIKHKLM